MNYSGMKFWCISLRTFHLWGGLVFIMDDHDNFPNWMMTLNSMFPSWMMTLNSMFPCWTTTLNSMFPLLEDDTIFLPLGRRFYFLIVNRLIRDN